MQKDGANQFTANPLLREATRKIREGADASADRGPGPPGDDWDFM
jgi:hypothetical protein